MSGASGRVTGQPAGDRIRQPVSIEELLRWAYCDQMVDKAVRAPIVVKSKGPLAAYSSLWSEGVPVESSAGAPNVAADDAWVVHDLVQQLGRVTVDCGQDLAATRYHEAPQYRGADPPTGCLGNADQVGRPWPTNGLVNIDVRTLVMVHASRATRPEYPPRPSWRLKAVHKGMVHFPKRGGGGVYRKGWYHHLEIEGVTPGEAAETAAIYDAWWGALDQIRRQLLTIRLMMFMPTLEMPKKIQARP